MHTGLSACLAVLGVLASGATVAQPSPPTESPSTNTAESSSVPLWGGLRLAMSADEVATVLRSTEGIRRVEVRARANRATTFSIRYADDGISLVGLRHHVTPTMGASGLEAVTLTSTGCLSLMNSKWQELRRLLAERYTPYEVFAQRSPTGYVLGASQEFSNSVTHVTATLESIAAPQYVPAPARTGTLGQLAESIAAASADAARERCPADAGDQGSISITYRSQEAVAAMRDAERVKQEEQRRRDLDRL